MTAAVERSKPLSEPYLTNRSVDSRADKFAALHAACWSGGRLLYVPRGVVVDEPLHVSRAMSDGGADFGHTLVVLEDGAEATLLTRDRQRRPAKQPACTAARSRSLVGPGARLRFVNLQNWGTGVWHFAHQKALVGQDAALQWTIAALGAASPR